MRSGPQVKLTSAKKLSFIQVRNGVVQHKCACGGHSIKGECDGCKKKREATDHSAINNAPPIVHDVLRSPGQPLDAGTRAFMEPRFGHDFSGVRVHTDARAAESAQAVNALAYTVGRDVVFGSGQYAPSHVEGRRLMAHELTHVVQQAAGLTGPFIQRMAACPATLESNDPVPPGWKAYHGDPCVFHCCYRGILEDRIPTPEDPQNECFFDHSGTLVDATHPNAKCGGSPNQYDSAKNPIKHALIDSGGILRSGWGAFWGSRGNDVTRIKCGNQCAFVPGPGKFFCFEDCMKTMTK